MFFYVRLFQIICNQLLAVLVFDIVLRISLRTCCIVVVRVVLVVLVQQWLACGWAAHGECVTVLGVHRWIFVLR